eukprot:TRINITY_DN35562_c0_g1_i1.p2 TRINITY_DN35562_c0_g1~~TRINITY_DN35562_c0_g1_i1.p2  ORF type:complete len:177 (-),score=41.89 TRINITY_DN35562_c0_g1_i1:399-929(-)
MLDSDEEAPATFEELVQSLPPAARQRGEERRVPAEHFGQHAPRPEPGEIAVRALDTSGDVRAVQAPDPEPDSDEEAQVSAARAARAKAKTRFDWHKPRLARLIPKHEDTSSDSEDADSSSGSSGSSSSSSNTSGAVLYLKRSQTTRTAKSKAKSKANAKGKREAKAQPQSSHTPVR